ncbi:MAG: DUF1343 domain-containing protein [Pseudomonadales bacterium]|nr:DUF1343 domain-containing protein [Pseudomonadales bacterium]MBO6595181.1 DUF1343 domain-containing protein [Pseudomonadales bacterium]MBO6656214.1 DUF1343 domain-containing protein [Pseudomonadales bacterium]MBO6701687.1 DUF1343 domain-containing protein [Pseudomonadales bacterium]MBO6821260.1 DUF1343 domain-containing protein [Pseudomonadales bacterium]
MTFKFGLDRLLDDKDRLQRLQSSNVGLVAHPASISSANQHSIDALMANGCHVLRAFGPQHGMRGDKQDNMIESEDYLDQLHQLPVISLYGEHRYPTPDMLADLDIILFDLQDIGCRIYTYITTLYYFCEACSEAGIELWVLDRPNPAGRPVDGLYLEDGQESFVGCAPMPTRHGLTVGELARWFKSRLSKELNLTIIEMAGYAPEGLGLGWPSERPWINPSPNAASVNMARCFPGTVLLEGTTISEGRGTTIPLEVLGAPALPIPELLNHIQKEASHLLAPVYIRECFFSPTFHKHVGELCTAFQVHTDCPGYDHEAFMPYSLIAACLKGIRQLDVDYDLWRFHDYEYELDRKPIDVINGGPALRTWVDDNNASMSDLLSRVESDARRWLDERRAFLLY